MHTSHTHTHNAYLIHHTYTHNTPHMLTTHNTHMLTTHACPQRTNKNVVFERLKKHGLDSPFALFIHEECDKMTHCLQGIHTSLQVCHASICCFTPTASSRCPYAHVQDLQSVLLPTCLGDAICEHPYLVDLALSILTLAVPKYWLELVGSSAPPGDWPLKDWVRDLVQRYTFIDRVLTGGLIKTPTYWLGGFFNPQAFLNVVQQVKKIVTIRLM